MAAILAVGAIFTLSVAGANDPPPQLPAAEVFTDAAARDLASSLLSGSMVEVSGVVTMPAGVSIPEEFVKELNASKDLAFNVDTFVSHSDGFGQVDATRTNSTGEVAPWTAYLVLENGTWKISATVGP